MDQGLDAIVVLLSSPDTTTDMKRAGAHRLIALEVDESFGQSASYRERINALGIETD